ncbi:unnamed protein product [Meganyctiphanes norvegica]|uniref:Uncharacterized protein n=1 Tax=Meganyctiphanes norvegica TaxID=48144 RepID=A0AAV2SNY0_MEGNR
MFFWLGPTKVDQALVYPQNQFQISQYATKSNLAKFSAFESGIQKNPDLKDERLALRRQRLEKGRKRKDKKLQQRRNLTNQSHLRSQLICQSHSFLQSLPRNLSQVTKHLLHLRKY